MLERFKFYITVQMESIRKQQNLVMIQYKPSLLSVVPTRVSCTPSTSKSGNSLKVSRQKSFGLQR